jgi:hypothetical protein
VIRIFFGADVSELRCEKYFVAAWTNRFTNQLFVVSNSLSVRGIQKEAEIKRSKNHRGGLCVITVAVELTHAHATESYAGNNGAL